MELPGLFDAAAGAPCLTMSLLGRHAAVQEILFEQREMRGQLAVEVAVSARVR